MFPNLHARVDQSLRRGADSGKRKAPEPRQLTMEHFADSSATSCSISAGSTEGTAADSKVGRWPELVSRSVGLKCLLHTLASPILNVLEDITLFRDSNHELDLASSAGQLKRQVGALALILGRCPHRGKQQVQL